MRYRLNIPNGLDFSALALMCSSDSEVFTYNSGPLEDVCAASGLAFAELDADPEESLRVIAAWYELHLANGGARHDAGDTAINAMSRCSLSTE
ncbi:hypothetical protein [Simplicispira suum]|nr:hypothetical protein [Simplicispira suum]ADV02200.1 hypothetical protein Alide_4598 [Alicycliphilus denitrificans BC]